MSLDDDREEEIKVPVPSAKHTYCGVCLVNYTDYITHINSNEHQINVSACPIYDEIDGFIE